MVGNSFPIKKELHKIVANLNEMGNIQTFHFYASEMQQALYLHIFLSVYYKKYYEHKYLFFINGEQKDKIGPVWGFVPVDGNIRKGWVNVVQIFCTHV
jgi:hypothetical protein